MWNRILRWWHTRDLWRRIGQHGWTAVYVGDYVTGPTWVYSVGFDETLDQPEIVVFDVPQAMAVELMWQVFTDLESGALVLEDGREWTEGAENRCVWRKVHPSQIDHPDNWFGFANLRREKRTGRRFGLEAFQLVLSDEHSRMPWEEGYDERLRRLQPALYLPAEDAAAAAKMGVAEREARRLMRERGWTAVPVDGPDIHWAYTIGLPETLGVADLIGFGPNGEGVANILVDVQAYLRDGTLTLQDGLRWNALGFEICWRRVHESQYLGINWFYLAKEIREDRTGARDAVDVFQFFFPDEAGKFPGEDGYAEAPWPQPQLFLPADVEPRTRRMLAAAGAV